MPKVVMRMLSPCPAPACPASLPPQAGAQWARPLWLWVPGALSQQMPDSVCSLPRARTVLNIREAKAETGHCWRCPGSDQGGQGERSCRGVCVWRDPGTLKL